MEAANAPNINLFEDGAKGDSVVDGVDMFDNTVAILFPGQSLAINLFHKIMFGFNAVKRIPGLLNKKTRKSIVQF
jgi:hypothetical protein